MNLKGLVDLLFGKDRTSTPPFTTPISGLRVFVWAICIFISDLRGFVRYGIPQLAGKNLTHKNTLALACSISHVVTYSQGH
ncbi:MAG: hypothetical protein P4L69_11025 [Desulfosporosinus sp.]|nr:hypothetical protein [Desulfosporosinus sp.]